MRESSPLTTARSSCGCSRLSPNAKKRGSGRTSLTHLQLHQDNLRLYQAIFAKDFAHADEHDRTLFIHKSILQLGIDLEIGWINWLENLIPALKSFDESSSNQAKPKEN